MLWQLTNPPSQEHPKTCRQTKDRDNKSTSCCHTLLCTGLAKEGKRKEEKTENTNTVSQQADYRGKTFSHTKETILFTKLLIL